MVIVKHHLSLIEMVESGPTLNGDSKTPFVIDRDG